MNVVADADHAEFFFPKEQADEMHVANHHHIIGMNSVGLTLTTAR